MQLGKRGELKKGRAKERDWKEENGVSVKEQQRWLRRCVAMKFIREIQNV